ncbi:hypothetical protein [Paractinoplanes hotanensis]|uniref:hypothetical protein n=1 Tax=Paractinoplanes hotanensis TaxID=2906497 RepID=UPI0034DAFDE5
MFHRLGRTRYADMCGSAATADILAVCEHDGGTAGFKAYRSALAATGLQTPDLRGVPEWGSVMGSDEASAYASASLALKHAIDNGELRPGQPGWRKAADQITRAFLNSSRDDLTGSTWLQWVYTERLQNWAEGRGAEHRSLATAITNQPVATAQKAGCTAVVAGWDGHARGVLTVADAVKPTSRAAITALRELGLTPVLLTGDHDNCTG